MHPKQGQQSKTAPNIGSNFAASLKRRLRYRLRAKNSAEALGFIVKPDQKPPFIFPLSRARP